MLHHSNSDFFTLVNGKYINELYAVDNEFIRQLAGLVVANASQGRAVSFVMKNKAQFRGEVSDRGVRLADKSVTDICTLSPLQNNLTAKNILEEVAIYRWNMLEFASRAEVSGASWQDMKYALLADYLLASCLCYVEVFSSKDSTVEKFYATKNANIAMLLANKTTPADLEDFVSYLRPSFFDLNAGSIRMLKLKKTKAGFSVSKPRAPISLEERDVKITPLFLIDGFVQGILRLLTTNVIKFTFIKDNQMEREMVTTLNEALLAKIYGEAVAASALADVRKTEAAKGLDRGYIKLPDLEVSKYDSITRSLNVARITKIEFVHPEKLDTTFSEVDFNNILPYLKNKVDTASLEMLMFIASDLLKIQLTPTKHLTELKNDVSRVISNKDATLTTTFKKEVHMFLMRNENIFKDYNQGKPQTYTGYEPKTSSFNFG